MIRTKETTIDTICPVLWSIKNFLSFPITVLIITYFIQLCNYIFAGKTAFAGIIDTMFYERLTNYDFYSLSYRADAYKFNFSETVF